jgi:hypothetical protein
MWIVALLDLFGLVHDLFLYECIDTQGFCIFSKKIWINTCLTVRLGLGDSVLVLKNNFPTHKFDYRRVLICAAGSRLCISVENDLFSQDTLRFYL